MIETHLLNKKGALSGSEFGGVVLQAGRAMCGAAHRSRVA